MRLGLFGGAFDPPHHAHIALVQTAHAQLQLDALRILPTGQAWHKARDLTPAVHRLAMARLAFAGLPYATVDPREIERAGPTYTVDTLRELRAEYPEAELVLLIGEDQAAALTRWHAWEEILATAIICIADRPGDLGARARFDPASLPQGRFCRLQLPPMAESATDIRRRAASGEGIAPLVPASVARYIAQHHLYQTA